MFDRLLYLVKKIRHKGIKKCFIYFVVTNIFIITWVEKVPTELRAVSNTCKDTIKL